MSCSWVEIYTWLSDQLNSCSLVEVLPPSRCSLPAVISVCRPRRHVHVTHAVTSPARPGGQPPCASTHRPPCRMTSDASLLEMRGPETVAAHVDDTTVIHGNVLFTGGILNVQQLENYFVKSLHQISIRFFCYRSLVADNNINSPSWKSESCWRVLQFYFKLYRYLQKHRNRKC